MARSWARFAALGETAATKRVAGTGGFLMVVACVLAVATVVTALCATRRRRKEVTNRSSSKEWTADSSRRSGGSDFQCNFKFAPKSPRALINSISSKKLLVTKKWGRSEDEELKAYDRAVMEDGDFLWQRTILMGERCQPPDFSGVIIYDHQGNRLPEFPPRSPKLNIFPPSLQADAIQQR